MSAEDCEKCRHINNCLGDCVGYEEVKPQEQTNEEWLHTLNTEQLAKWIAEEKMCRGYFIFPSMEEAIQGALKWLKEKHK